MCYRDGPAPRHAMTYPCPRISGVMSQVYDCGGDDYFNVAPASGSYLATHCNLFDNAFLAACTDVAPACGGTTVPDSNPQPPVSTTQPLVTGAARVGAVLTAAPGGWTNAPTAFQYQWEQGDGLTWIAVPGATGPALRRHRRRRRPAPAGARDRGQRRRVHRRLLAADRVRHRRGAGHDADDRRHGPAAGAGGRGAQPRARPAADRPRAAGAASASARSTSRSPAAACAPPPRA